MNSLCFTIMNLAMIQHHSSLAIMNHHEWLIKIKTTYEHLSTIISYFQPAHEPAEYSASPSSPAEESLDGAGDLILQRLAAEVGPYPTRPAEAEQGAGHRPACRYAATAGAGR